MTCDLMSRPLQCILRGAPFKKCLRTSHSSKSAPVILLTEVAYLGNIRATATTQIVNFFTGPVQSTGY